MKNKVIVIGGGPAGMMAAIEAKTDSNEVILCESNEKLGKKLYITGKGRCNVTNNCDVEELINHTVHNPHFMYSSFYSFTNQALMDLLEETGLPLKTERGGRVFPQSDKSSDVIKALTKLLKEKKVKIKLNTNIIKILIRDKKISGIITEQNETIQCDGLIVATGGKSYRSTGSDGRGYRLLEAVGHTVTELRPGLVPVETKGFPCNDFQGISLKNINMTLWRNNRKIKEEFGECLFTHFGMSGPTVLSLSSYITQPYDQYRLTIDLKPGLTPEKLDLRIQRDFEKYQNKVLKNALVDLFPNRLIPLVIKKSQLLAEQKINELKKTERKQLVSTIKNLPVDITKLRNYNEAIITVGGIDVKEINPSTMESKIISNLYIAGEVMDVDAVTGGYNLQIAFSSGWLAGNSIKKP
jgi:predicted Rossmann fold flavoprotein